MSLDKVKFFDIQFFKKEFFLNSYSSPKNGQRTILVLWWHEQKIPLFHTKYWFRSLIFSKIFSWKKLNNNSNIFSHLQWCILEKSLKTRKRKKDHFLWHIRSYLLSYFSHRVLLAEGQKSNSLNNLSNISHLSWVIRLKTTNTFKNHSNVALVFYILRFWSKINLVCNILPKNWVFQPWKGVYQVLIDFLCWIISKQSTFRRLISGIVESFFCGAYFSMSILKTTGNWFSWKKVR